MYWSIIKTSSDQSLGCKYCILRISDSLSLSSSSYKSLSLGSESNHWRSSSSTLSILNYFRCTSLHNSNARVSGSEIDTNYRTSFLRRKSCKNRVSENSSDHFIVLMLINIIINAYIKILTIFYFYFIMIF